ncbi:MAG: cytochrome C [Rhodobacteraceae bacterium]|nr:cytochrome C [Paracoccaceae bacterium]
MKSVILTLAVLAALGLAGAAAVVGFGLYNVSAAAGHLPGVSFVLHTTFRNSVALRAPPEEEVPPLDDPDLVALGAGHYATACAGCHGVPGAARSATVRAMVPEPPAITEAVAHWQPNELHWIVENGVKMSGMPAWPARNRKDEVWSVVAYLEALKTGTTPEMPSTRLAGEAYCRSCHGEVGGPVPRLDIQTPDYLEAQLGAYLSGERPSGIMAQAASLVPEERFASLAEAFSAGTAAPVDEAPREGPGAELAWRGTRAVPACIACHGTASEAAAPGRKGPRLFGQSRVFLATQLRLWRDGTLSHDRLMSAAAAELTEEDIDALSRYFSATGQ